MLDFFQIKQHRIIFSMPDVTFVDFSVVTQGVRINDVRYEIK